MKNPKWICAKCRQPLQEDGMQIVIATINILVEWKTLSLLLSI